MGRDDLDVLRGTLDVLLLKSLTFGPRHGYAIARWLRQTTDEELVVEEGALYPALHRLARRKLIKGEWGRGELRHRIKLYSLTPAGRRHLKSARSAWSRYSVAVGKVLHASS